LKGIKHHQNGDAGTSSEHWTCRSRPFSNVSNKLLGDGVALTLNDGMTLMSVPPSPLEDK